MKSKLTTIAAVLLILQSGGTQGANLKYLRTAKHRDFTRIVFEFQSAVQFKEPVIEGEGKFSVAFSDTTTILPRRILYKTTPIQRVRSIEFVQKETLLTAVVKLSFPHFKLKTFTLFDPNRVVIDAYLITPPSREIVTEKSLHTKPLAKESKELETKEPEATPEGSPAKELTRVVKKEPKVIPQKSPVKQTGENYNLQTYMLILLNFLTIVIVLLLSFNLLKKKSGINSKHIDSISDSLKTVDERIAAIDTMINREFKKHD